VAQRPPGTAGAGELRAHDALAARRAHGPPAIALEADGVLRNEDAPSPPRSGAERRSMSPERLGSAGDPQMSRMPQRRSVTGRLQPQRVGIGHTVASVEREGDRV